MTEAWRYLAISGAGFCVDFASLVLLSEVFGLHYLIAGALAFTAGLVVVYLGSVRWVFAKRRLAEPSREFVLFAVIGLVTLQLNEVVLYTMTDIAQFHYTVSKVFAAAVVVQANFLARKVLLFR